MNLLDESVRAERLADSWNCVPGNVLSKKTRQLEQMIIAHNIALYTIRCKANSN